MQIDTVFKAEVQFMLERFLEAQLDVIDGMDGKPMIIGIPFVVQNITEFLVR